MNPFRLIFIKSWFHKFCVFFLRKFVDSWLLEWISTLRGTKFSNRSWRHRQSWFFAKCFSFREHFNDRERRKLSESFCACFFVLDLKYVITNVSRKVFFQHDMRAGTSTDLFQNNKICTTPRSKICSGDVHVLDLFLIFTPLLKYCAS